MNAEPVLIHRPARERSRHIDTLRALALFGVIVMNVGAMNMRFVGLQLMSAAGPLDFVAMALDLVSLQGKARAAFAFLFGVGFAILMRRAEARGADFRTFYLRRMTALLAFGIVNQVFLFWGDILCLYAILGFVLLLFRDWSDGAVLRAGLGLVLLPPLAIGLVEAVNGGPIPSLWPEGSALEAARGLTAFTSSHYLDAIAFGAPQAILRYAIETPHMVAYVANVLGLFLLGSWSVRRGLLLHPSAHRPLLRRIARIALPVGLVLSLIYATRYGGVPAKGALYGAVTAASIGAPILAFGYIAALTLLFSRRAHAFQALLAPAGRMALTNYLLSGAIGSIFFYGWGLGMMGSLGMAALNLFAIGLFAVLTAFSHLWLSRFSFGPAELLWRRLSYGPASAAASTTVLAAERP